jgi:uncharacterized protein YfaS (alpha-2-macroglobulin family)
MPSRLFLILSLVTVLFGILCQPVAEASEQRQIITIDESDYFGFDLRSEENVSLEQCKTACLGDGLCQAFTYNTSAQWCFLKSDFAELRPFTGAIAGRIETLASEQDLGAPPVLSFVPVSLFDEARRYKNELKAHRTESPEGFSQLTKAGSDAMAAGDAASAKEYFIAALSIGHKHGTGTLAPWHGLARAALALKAPKNSGQNKLHRIAVSSALNGYSISRTASARADILHLLAQALEQQSYFRPALEAYKASLELANTPQVRAAFSDLRARQGFRVIGHDVESDNRSPRICAQFSETLVKAGVDYSTFVTVDGSTPKAVEAKDRQICVEGLSHGRSFRLVLRSGLPAAIGETLQAPVALTVYVRDRNADVRFTGSKFVLPSTARHGIPLVSINTSRANLELFRVGERALTPLLNGSRFLRQLDSYDLKKISREIGVPVWKGSVEISSKLNKEVVTSIPIDEAIPKRKPGVYVLTATSEGDRREDWVARATQWFVISDIGLATFAGDDGLSVFARSLASAKPLAGVKLQLLARNNEVLGTATSNEDGRASFTAGLTRGTESMAPAIMVARHGDGDFVFLDMTQAGFDLSDRGVTGRKAPGALDVFAWLERGIYRAGETVHVGALARDHRARAVQNLPLTFIFKRPDGLEDRRIVSQGVALGGYFVDFPLQANAQRGTWQIRIHADPKISPLAEKSFLVEDFVPDKIEFDLVSTAKTIAANGNAAVEIDGRFLYGAPAAGLSLEGEVKISTVRVHEDFTGYFFGLADEEKQTALTTLSDLPVLNNDGKASFDVRIGQIPSTTQLLSASIVTRIREGAGRAIERTLELPVTPTGTMIGVKPEFEGGQIAENSNANFNIIAIAPEGVRQNVTGLAWSLVKLERNYQWYRSRGSWRYEPVIFTRKIANGRVGAQTTAAGKISHPVSWGRYRFEVSSDAPNGPATSVEFNAGWHVDAASTETPDGLEIALDKEAYAPGETAQLSVSPRFSGELLITIGANRLHIAKSVSVPASGARIPITVGKDWGGGAYVTATLYRPGEAQQSRMPMRAIGIKWLKVDPGPRKLRLKLATREKTQSGDVLSIPVELSGLTPGTQAFVSIAAVDVGILNLTDFTPPDPANWYFGQRRLGMEIRDMYGRLIDGSQGATGRIRSGGDAVGMSAKGSPPTQKLVALVSGPVALDNTGKATVKFELPQFNGTVRVMALAWSGDGVGHGTSDIIVREPVVLTTHAPKFLSPGDDTQLRIDFANTDGPSGDYVLDIFADGAVAVENTVEPRIIQLTRGGRHSEIFQLHGETAGDGSIAISLTHAEGLKVSRRLQISVRPAALPVMTRKVISLTANGGVLTAGADLLAGVHSNSAQVSIGVSRHAGFQMPSLLMALDSYPYGCAEQTTSKALPLLYLSDLPAGDRFGNEKALRAKVQDAIDRVLTFQSPNGGFGLWSPGSGDLWLDAYVTDFLTRAREKNYQVPDQAMLLALGKLQNTLAYQTNLKEHGSEIAYALYVLARNRKASAGNLRYYADTRLDEFNSPMARAQIGASLALYGDPVRAERGFASALRAAKSTTQLSLSRSDFGSSLRDQAAMLALAAETRPAPSLIPAMIKLVSNTHNHARYTSTQEKAWMALAARAFSARDDAISLEVDGAAHEGSFSRQLSGRELTTAPLSIVNRSATPAEVTISILATPENPLPAGGKGFSISRTYYTLDGSKANITQARQNERFVAVLNVTEANSWPSRILVSDLLPAGFEIDNPHLVGSADLSGFEWIGDVNIAHTEFRTDRFTAALNRTRASPRDFALAYVVRAVTPGTYTHPAAYVEDMYRPQFNARTAETHMQVVTTKQ